MNDFEVIETLSKNTMMLQSIQKRTQDQINKKIAKYQKDSDADITKELEILDRAKGLPHPNDKSMSDVMQEQAAKDSAQEKGVDIASLFKDLSNKLGEQLNPIKEQLDELKSKVYDESIELEEPDINQVEAIEKKY